MFPHITLHQVDTTRFPRARGDVPVRMGGFAGARQFSPRTRGCSYHHTPLMGWPDVFPAHAGMFRPCRTTIRMANRFPRARGDVPHPPGRDPPPGAFSPRTRGCSPHSTPPTGGRKVFPAHAGMFLNVEITTITLPSFPRARGDVPSRHGADRLAARFSPRTRGCSDKDIVRVNIPAVFPAHAGMFRNPFRIFCLWKCFPRARGDVPTGGWKP